MVVVGVALELLVIRHEWRDDMETWALAHFGVLRSPGRPSLVKFLVEVASVLLITAGIVGELWIGIEITSINGTLRSKNTELRTVSDQLVALVNSEAEEAKKEANAADLARVKIEASVAWRRLSEQQKNDFGKKLEKYAGLALVQYNGGDSEAAAFAVSIEDALSRAHWRKYSATSPYMSSSQLPTADEKVLAKAGFFTGVAIQGGDSSTLAAVRTLIKLLVDAGFDAGQGWTPPMYPKDSSVRASAQERQTIEVYVKHRPEGPQGEYKLQAEREAKAKKKQAQSSQVAK